MEILYAWLFVFGGATLVLFGIRLFASDRKLRKQQRQAEARRRKPQFSESARHDNHELQEKIVNLTKQLHANEARVRESAGTIQEITDRNAHLQTEVASLKRQLQADQTTIEEFEAEHRRLLDRLQTTESMLAATASRYQEVVDRDAQTQSELAETKAQIDQLMIRHKESLAQIDFLSNRLVASERTVKELQTARDRLGAAEAENGDLRAAARELRDEITILKDRLQSSEERLMESVPRHQHAAERYATLQTQLAELTQRAEQSEAATRELRVVREQLADAESREMILRNQQEHLRAQMATLQRGLPSEKENERERPTTAWSSRGRKWRLGIIPAIAGAVILGAVAVGFVGTSSDKSFGSKPPAGSVDTGASTPQRPSPSVAAPKNTEVSKPAAVARSAPRLSVTFEITRPTPVYSAPSEISLLIGNAEPGLKINVVNSRDGWLEIRAGQGRRSGFIRQESAVQLTRARD